MLLTNANVTPLQAALRDLLQVENLFLPTKAIMRTRPIFHSSDAAIRGHVFCSFRALAMQKYLDDLSIEAGVTPEWKELLRDLDRLQQVRLQYRGAEYHRLVPSGSCRAAAARPTNCPAEGRSPHKIPPPARRGRPRRSATPLRISP
jgi:hypothetical protein